MVGRWWPCFNLGGRRSIDKLKILNLLCSIQARTGAKARSGLWYSGDRELVMNITSPFFVVPLIVAVFTVCILWGTNTKEDGSADHDGHATH